MIVFSARNLHKTHGDKLLLDDATLALEERDRAGLIGINGSGKTTLLRILAGEDAPDAGEVTRREGLRLSFLSQNPDFDPLQTPLDHIFAAHSAGKAVGEYEAVAEELAELTAAGATTDPAREAELLRRQESLGHELEAANAWNFEARARAILGKLGLHDLRAPLGTLSGGQRKRVALARALLEEADLLLLDEPTNHLDIETVAWLEEQVARYPGAVLLVTHDRYFLDRVTTHIYELDRAHITRYEGDYANYVARKAEQLAADARSEQRRQSILRVELAWLQRGARARTTKQKARIDRYDALAGAGPEAQQEKLRFEVAARRMGKKVVRMKDVGKQYDDRWLVKGLTYEIAPGERIGLVGRNGSGKTTLANLITGRLAPDAGRIEIGETIAFAYYDQESAELEPTERVLDYVRREGGENLRCADGSVLSAAAMLERFHFTSNMLAAQVGKLSGGERRRLYLVTRLLRDPNFLVLDEPTNDLDLATLEALEDLLEGFSGCLLVISHDRFFLDRTVDKILAPETDGTWTFYPGNYTVYAERRAEQVAAAQAETARAAQLRADANRAVRKAEAKAGGAKPGGAKPAAAPAEKTGKLSYMELRELARLEEEIPAMEQRIEDLGGEIGACASDYARLHALSAEQAALADKLADAMERWEHLAARQG